MAAIVKANPSLTAGGLAVLRRSFTTNDDGTMRYEVDYCCLSQYASRWMRRFRTKSQPPTDLPAALLQLQLAKTPELYDLQTETVNGLTYFRAVYSAGVTTEVIITEESDVRNFTVTYERDLGATSSVVNGTIVFTSLGTELVTSTYDYISVTVTAEAKNANLPDVKGRVEPIDGRIVPYLYGATTIDKKSTTRSSRGEYTYRLSSSGVINSRTL